jgi:hypothetical protein
MALPEKQGLYDPRNEHDSCGVGFVADIKGRKTHAIVRQGLQILVNLDHRGGTPWHQRFSTNTFPSWRWRIPTASSPQRRNQHRARQRQLDGGAPGFGEVAAVRRRPRQAVADHPDGQSDTACFDNALELLVAGGYSLSHAMMMLIPEAWAGNPLMDEDRRAFYEYHAALMEPWDGPAAIAFTDGRQIGATLDRNGLRPGALPRHRGRLVIMASEWACCRSPREDRAQVAPAARQDAADRSRRGPHHLRRGAEASSLAAPPLRGVAARARRSSSRTCGDPGSAVGGAEDPVPCSIASRPSATRRKTSSSS